MKIKRIALIVCIVLCFVLCIVLCSCTKESKNDVNNEKIKIVTTAYVHYDFAKNIAGDFADIKMLIPAGSEVHTFEPTPSDIMEISDCDMLVLSGGESDGWITDIIDTVQNDDMKLVHFVDFCALKRADVHEHEKDLKELLSSAIHYDEHVWTSPENAIKICDGIKNALCEIDTKNAQNYQENFENYAKKLQSLSAQIRNVAENSKRKTLVFCDRFPFLYFADEYGFDYISAFPGCASNTEPSAKVVTEIIQKVKSENIPAVFKIEFSNGKIAQTVSEETGCRVLLFHSCHNVTKEQFDKGEGYIELMTQNLENLKEALS